MNKMQELKSVPGLVKDLKVSSDKIRYWVSLLGAKTVRKGRISFLSFAIAAQIEMMARLIDQGSSPKNAAHEVLTMIIPEETTFTVPALENKKFDALEKAVLTMAEQVKELTDQVKELRKENKILRFQLTPTVEKTKITPWIPRTLKPISYPWYKKIWLELTSPELLRNNSW